MIADRSHDPYWVRHKRDIDGAALVRPAARAAERRSKAPMLSSQVVDKDRPGLETAIKVIGMAAAAVFGIMVLVQLIKAVL